MDIDLLIEKNKPLGPMTTFGIGGTADYFLLANDPGELEAGLAWAKQKNLPVKIFGGGSNSFFDDKSYHCLVIRVLNGKIEIKNNLVLADAGVPTSLLITKANKAGLAGIEKMAGIPGTIGGAVAGNSGAYGTCIADVVNRVEIIDGDQRRWLTKEECQFEYRESVFKTKPWIITRVELKLTSGDPATLQATSDKCDQTRNSRYPEGTRGPGCYFKNTLVKDLTTEQLKQIPAEIIKGGKIPTGWLIEQAGMKGKGVGDARVANFHANFMINVGKATAKDVLTLQETVQNAVEAKFGIRPQPEARLL